jgi:hypothetical protein
MDEKHDPTRAMLNDEKHPTRPRTNDNRPPLQKVIFQKNYFQNLSFFLN